MTGYFIHHITQEKAVEIGIKLYFDGKKCVNDNYYLRRTGDRRCTCKECREDKAKRERLRKLSSPELSESRKNYSKEYRQKNRDKLNKSKKDYLLVKKQENSETYQAYLEKLKRNNRKTRERNPFMAKAAASFSRAKKKYPDSINPSYGELDIFVAQQAYELKEMREHTTGMEWAVDHMTPLARGGLHQWDNLQLIPFKLNLFKKHKLAVTKPYEWLRYTL